MLPPHSLPTTSSLRALLLTLSQSVSALFYLLMAFIDAIYLATSNLMRFIAHI